MNFPTEDNLTPRSRVVLLILDLLKKPKKVDLFQSINVILFDEISQVSEKLLAIFDFINCEICNINTCMGVPVIVFAMDYAKI